MTDYLGWVGNASLVVGVLLLGTKRRQAFLWTVAGGVAWGIASWEIGRVDMITICVVFTVLALWNWFQWGFDMSYQTKDSGKREQHSTGAQRDVRENKGRYDLIPPMPLERVAKLFERGAKKYEARNWEKGFPFDRQMDSLLRHANQYLAGDRSEDHLAAVIFNAMTVMHYEEMIALGKMDPGLDNLPRHVQPDECLVPDTTTGYTGPEGHPADPVTEQNLGEATEQDPGEEAGGPYYRGSSRYAIDTAKSFIAYITAGNVICLQGLEQLVTQSLGVNEDAFYQALLELGAKDAGSCLTCHGPVVEVPVQQ